MLKPGGVKQGAPVGRGRQGDQSCSQFTACFCMTGGLDTKALVGSSWLAKWGKLSVGLMVSGPTRHFG